MAANDCLIMTETPGFDATVPVAMDYSSRIPDEFFRA
jgi:hypothetical protein